MKQNFKSRILKEQQNKGEQIFTDDLNATVRNYLSFFRHGCLPEVSFPPESNLVGNLNR